MSLHAHNFIDLTGKTFGRWKVLSLADKRGSQTYWKCLCSCGTEKSVSGASLSHGGTRSCGCYRVEWSERNGFAATHRGTGTVEHRTWAHMHSRCYNPKVTEYPRYGGRGIIVCERWRKFENFLADLGPRPSPNHSVDRIDVNGNYEPGNVRWATSREQARNKRTTRRVSLDGETLMLDEWAKRYGINRAAIYGRLRLGWSMEAAIKTPLKWRKSK